MNTQASPGVTGRELRCPYCEAEPGLACTTSDGYAMVAEHAARDASLGPLTRRLLVSSARAAAIGQH